MLVAELLCIIYYYKVFTLLNPDVRKQSGERYVALNLQLLLPRMASAGKIYQKGEVEYSLVREQFGESGNRYFAKAQFAMDNPSIKTFTRVPKQHQTKQRCFCLRKEALDKEILVQLEQGEHIKHCTYCMHTTLLHDLANHCNTHLIMFITQQGVGVCNK